MKKIIITFVCMFFLIGNYANLYAQQRQGQGQGGRGGTPQQGLRPGQNSENRPGMGQREAMQDLKRLEQLRMIKLLDLLKLDPATEALVIPHIREHNKEMFQLMRKHQNKIDQLANGLKKEKFSDKEIFDRIIEIDSLEMERHQEVVDFHLKAKEILTADQLGKLYIFQARFGGEVLEKMGNFRKAQDDFRERESGN